MICKMPFCGRDVRARELCAGHYNQVRRGQELHPFVGDLPFSEWLSQRITPEPNTGCWLWAGAVTPKGYASARWKGRAQAVHRLVFKMTRGAIPRPLVLDHLCRVRCCVNPAHLEVVTVRENNLRGVGLMAQNARKTSCVNGHPFTVENTRVRNDGRECIICKRAAAKRRGHPERGVR